MGAGLCDVPLYVFDPTMEYRVAPDQDCHILGKQITINHYSMRSGAITPHRTYPDEIRILVIGDSIVFAGNRVDQSELATSIIERELSKQFSPRHVVVCNISAGSWGPANQLAYLKMYGTFDPDLSVIVTSSDDIADVPTFEPIVGVSVDHPNHRPASAFWQICTRFAPRAFAIVTQSHAVSENPIPPHADPSVLVAINDMVQLLHKNNKPVLYVIHRATWNLDDDLLTGVKEMIESATKQGAQLLDLQPALKASMQSGSSPYRDALHPNAVGQQVIGNEILKVILPILKAQSATTQPAS